MKHNLVYYAYFNLKSISNYINAHIFLLKRYSHIFDGVKIIYIATDYIIDEEIENTYKSLFEFLDNPIIKFVINNPENRESEYFIQQLSDIKEKSEKDSITFYGHTKGSTHDINDNILKWITCMYFFNLESENLLNIQQSFKDNKGVSGIFRVDKVCYPWVLSDWHFSGTFFWINNQLIFSKDWNKMEKGRFSVEEYPGRIFNIKDSSNSEVLYNKYTDSLISGYDGYDLKYPGYWDIAFNSNLLPTQKLNDFYQLLEDLKIE